MAGARNVLAGSEWVGKRCALLAIEHFQAPAGPEVAGVVLDTTQPAFLRTQAALTLGRLGGSLALPDMADAGADLSLVLRDTREPDTLRQACAESLAVLDPATLERDATALLADANSSPALARRLNERLTDLGLSAPAQGGE